MIRKPKMHEFRIGGSWHPCHLLHDFVEDGYCMIFTRNGSVTSEQLNDVRKMRKEDYLQNRKEVIEWIGKFAYHRGFHENLDDDLKLFDSVDDFMYCEQKEICEFCDREIINF